MRIDEDGVIEFNDEHVLKAPEDAQVALASAEAMIAELGIDLKALLDLWLSSFHISSYCDLLLDPIIYDPVLAWKITFLKWYIVLRIYVEGGGSHLEYTGSNNTCGLCRYWLYTHPANLGNASKDCMIGCPVALYAKIPSCYDTPYYAVTQTIRNNFKWGGLSKETIKGIMAEIQFLHDVYLWAEKE